MNYPPEVSILRWEICVSCLLHRHGFRSAAVRKLCGIVLLMFCGATLLPAQSSDSGSADSAVSAVVADGSFDSPGTIASPASSPQHPSIAPDESSSRAGNFVLPASNVVPTAAASSGKFHFKSAFIQSFNENLFFHVWRVAFDPGLRYNLAHKPFWHDYLASFKGYDMSHWGDGDDFVVNDIGHPLEGAVFGRTFLQNSPRSLVVIGKDKQYWTSRLKAMAWATAWSTQLELGPISETSIGNQGGFTYVPGCGVWLSCLNNPQYPKAPTTNTGWTDFVVTPLIGTAWILGEDTIDKYIVMPVAKNHRILGGRVLRSALEPSRSFAALFAGKFPWMLPAPEHNFVVSSKTQPPTLGTPDLRPPVDHWEIGTQYTDISLPVLSNNCAGGACRKSLSGVGFNFTYNFTRGIAADSTLNFIPGQQGTKAMTEGLFGLKMGARYDRFGVFGKVRPGLIYYSEAMPGGGDNTPSSLTRFACDLGGIVEIYPNRNSTVRFDVGTTLVRYLSDHSDPKQYPLGSNLSTQYIVTQGNFQVATSYTYRF